MLPEVKSQQEKKAFGIGRGDLGATCIFSSVAYPTNHCMGSGNRYLGWTNMTFGHFDNLEPKYHGLMLMRLNTNFSLHNDLLKV